MAFVAYLPRNCILANFLMLQASLENLPHNFLSLASFNTPAIPVLYFLKLILFN